MHGNGNRAVAFMDRGRRWMLTAVKRSRIYRVSCRETLLACFDHVTRGTTAGWSSVSLNAWGRQRVPGTSPLCFATRQPLGAASGGLTSSSARSLAHGSRQVAEGENAHCDARLPLLDAAASSGANGLGIAETAIGTLAPTLASLSLQRDRRKLPILVLHQRTWHGWGAVIDTREWQVRRTVGPDHLLRGQLADLFER